MPSWKYAPVSSPSSPSVVPTAAPEPLTAYAADHRWMVPRSFSLAPSYRNARSAVTGAFTGRYTPTISLALLMACGNTSSPGAAISMKTPDPYTTRCAPSPNRALTVTRPALLMPVGSAPDALGGSSDIGAPVPRGTNTGPPFRRPTTSARSFIALGLRD